MLWWVIVKKLSTPNATLSELNGNEKRLPVCYCVIEAPYVRSGHVFANFYTLDDDSERPMDYDTSLLP